ncbi:MAG: hypothetical protein ACTS4V_00825 [Candidatus Hodgkinia cicadicola]
MERLTTFEVCLATDVTFPESKTEERERGERELSFIWLERRALSLVWRLNSFDCSTLLSVYVWTFETKAFSALLSSAFGPSGFQPLSPPLILYESCFRCSLLRSPSGF